MNKKSYLSDLIPIEAGGFEIMIPKHFDSNLRNKIKASIISGILEYKSIDYVLNKVLPEDTKKQNTDFADVTADIVDKIKNVLKIIEEKHEDINYKEERTVIFGLHMALKRLKISYESCIMLINLGCFIEADCIIRLIFEQLNYCINICELSDEEFQKKMESNDKILNPTTIHKLKNIIKHIDIGRLYGTLSKKAHLDISQVGNFIKYDNNIGNHLVTLRSRDESSISALLLLIVCYIHEVVLEYSFKEYIHKFDLLSFENSVCCATLPERYKEFIELYKIIYK